MKDILTRGVAEVIERAHLERALKSKKKLRVKLGIDPTAPDLHLGHAVVLRKLRQFQDLGHKVVLIIGDFTATIGDPTGRSEERKPLSLAAVKRNEKSYLKEAGKILNIKKVEVRHNGEWFLKEKPEAFIKLSRSSTLQQVLRRADFKKRLKEGSDLTLLEALYPVLQGYDSVKVRADVEVGGTDQKFNLLMGRRVQRHFGVPEQDILTVPLLEGTDGVRKMSKSFDNYVGLAELPEAMFGKLMAIPDSLIARYFELCTDVSEKRIKEFSTLLKRKKFNPRDAKMILAYEVASLYHGKAKAKAASKEFERIFRTKALPTRIPEKRIPLPYKDIVGVLVHKNIKLASSKSNAWRLVKQGGVRINGEKVLKPQQQVLDKDLIQVGPRHFIRISYKK
ncbi:MAG: tyrosine--tRNA ligase [Candidatus Colwellbacteria bacterium]